MVMSFREPLNLSLSDLKALATLQPSLNLEFRGQRKKMGDYIYIYTHTYLWGTFG